MKRILPVLVFSLCFNFLSAQTVYKDYVDGRLYIKCSGSLLNSVSQENPRNLPISKLGFINTLAAKYGISKAYKPYYQADDDLILPYILKIEFSKTEQVAALIEELSRVRGVEYAEKVPLMKTDILPNDPTFPAQLTQINAPNAWNVFNGNSNITVAIVDNAVMWTHQDLVANTYTNAGEIAGNNIDDDANGYIDDVNGWDVADVDNNANPTILSFDHGTHCAGIAGARTDNAIGIASIGWNIKIIPVKSTADASNANSIDDGYGGIVYAARAKARVISCSWGGGGFSNSDQAVINYAWAKGCLIVAAAGNNGVVTPNYPGAYANVYCVASVDGSNVKSGFSNYGTWVDISAPGENIYSTIPNASTGTYGFKSGTSMATPLVAGLAGLMLSKCSYMTQNDIINCINSTAANIYTLAANNTYSATQQLGAGRIEAFQAMNCASGFLTIAPIANFFAVPRITCPNTPVNFYDSSLYVPNSWSWVFQNGTPATSTSSNPVVQWANPGTYSVALTVSNGNGTNTATKLAYITVAGPIALPLVEGFEAAAFLPANWTTNNIMNDNVYWTRANWAGGFGTSTACAVFDNYNLDAIGHRDEMRTPKYNFNNVATARIRFDVAYARYNSFYSDSLEVKLSTNCGVSWTSIYLKGGTTLSTRSDLSANTFTPTNAQWRTDSVDITLLTAGQGNVMFSFINRGHYGQAIYLDNINLAFPTPTLNAVASASACAGTSLTALASGTAVASYTWSFPGGSPASSTATNPSVSYPSAGLYTMTLLGINGTATTAVTRTVNVVGLPVITINSPTICSGASATLTANGAVSGYTWTNGPMTQSLSASPAVTTVYTVTGESSSCLASKTGTIFVNITPTVTVNSPTICSGSPGVITPTGAVSYTLAGLPPAAFPFTVSPQATTVYTIIGATNSCVDSKTVSVTVNQTPTLSVNNASICQGASASLSVTGAVAYTWSSGPTGTVISVSPATTTNYIVTGTTLGCSDTKTATVNVEIPPALVVANQLICPGTSATLSASGAATYSWNTNATTSSIVINPASTTVYSVTGTNTLCIANISATVFVANPPILTAFASPSVSCAGSTVNLNSSTIPQIPVSWFGPGGATSPTVAPTVSTTYTAVMNYTVTGPGTVACSTSSLVQVTVNPVPSSTAMITLPNCSNACSGGVNAISSSGTPPYSYTLAGSGCTTLPCLNLCAGNYTFVTGDASNCTSSFSFAMAAPVNNLSAPISFTSISCPTCSDGVLMANVAGGLAPFTYSWAPSGGNQATTGNLAPGCYTVTITDANGCSIQSASCLTAPNTTTGISPANAANSTLLIYPNPAQKQVVVEYQGVTFDYVLYNNLGQLISKKQNNANSVQIDLEHLAKGVYLIEVTAGETKSWKKLLVE
jgi:serine protease